MLRSKYLICFMITVLFPISGYAYNDTRVFISTKCPVSGSGPEAIPLAIAAAVLPKLIDTTIDYTAAALKAASEKEDFIQTAATSAEFYSFANGNIKLNPAIGCVIVISGDFAEPGPQADFGVFKSIKDQLIENFGLSAAPKLYFESNLGYSKDRTFFRLLPKIFYAKDFNISSWFKSDRDYVLSLSFYDPSKGDNALLASATLSFSSVKKNEYRSYHLSDLKSGWMPVPTIGQTALAKYNDYEKLKTNYEKSMVDNSIDNFMIQGKLSRDVTDKLIKASLLLCETERAANKVNDKSKLDDNCKVDPVSLAVKQVAVITSSDSLSETKQKISVEEEQLSKMTLLTPFSLQVSITETKNSLKFLKFFSDVANASKEDFKTALKDNLKIDTNKPKTEKDKADSEAINQENIFKAEIDVQSAINTKNKLVNPTAEDLAIADFNISIAKLKANSAYRSAGKPEPYNL